jgi:AcrR family transcriptional regulator
MPRGFSDREKELIHDSLLMKGRELFINYGLKKTSIADLCREAGIALGSFYIFYSSKEEKLYFESWKLKKTP